MIDAVLRDELLARAERDQRVREATPLREPWPEEVAAECREVDADNTAFLKTVIAARGWPGRDLVGSQAAAAAWLLCQHAATDPDFQRLCLGLLADAVTAGEAEPSHLALLTDRVRVAEGRPQVYGSQYSKLEDGDFGPCPIEDPEHVDARRDRVGLEPFADYDRRMRDLYG